MITGLWVIEYRNKEDSQEWQPCPDYICPGNGKRIPYWVEDQLSFLREADTTQEWRVKFYIRSAVDSIG